MKFDDIDPPADGYIRLYRACNKYNLGHTQLGAEMPSLHPRDPDSDLTEFDHIQYGHRYWAETAYISFTVDPIYAFFYAVQRKAFFNDDREVIAFDIEEEAVRDVSTYRDVPNIVKNYANKAQERLVSGPIEVRKPAWRVSSAKDFAELVAGAKDMESDAFVKGWRGILYVEGEIGDLHADRLYPEKYTIDEAQDQLESDVEGDDGLSEALASKLNV